MDSEMWRVFSQEDTTLSRSLFDGVVVRSEQNQLKRKDVRVATACNVVGVEPSTDSSVAALRTMEFKVCAAEFQACFGSITFCSISPFWNGNVYSLPLYAGSI